MKRLLALSCAALVALSSPAYASSVDVWDPVTQTFKTASTAYPLPVTGTFSLGAFVPSGGAVSLSASTTSTAVALGATASTVAVANTGANTVYVLFGTSSGTTATTSNGFPVLAGQTVFLGNGANTYIAGITASSTSTLLVTPGSGLPAITGGGASSGGSITIASGGVASGAYASGAFASGSFAAGALASGSVAVGAYSDGAIATMGTQADAAWTSGNGTLIALGKATVNAINASLPAGSNIIGNVRIDQTTNGTTNAITSVSSVTGGATAYHLAGGTAATTNSTLVSTGAHKVYSVNVINTTSTIYYLRIYDSAAAPTCSSATGALMTIPIPNAAAAGAGAVLYFGDVGFAVANGFGFCVTGGGADTDNTSAATGVYINATYK